jgi:GDP-4-dehydro-6-deoxy-D-mannose reductase
VTINLVTGADGFVGQHLIAELLDRGERVVGAVKETPPALTTLSQDHASQVEWTVLELEERETVAALISEVRADRIFHLAGLSSVAESHDDPVAPLRVNVVGTLYLLEELARIRKLESYDPPILISGSGQVYGASATRYRPLTEKHPLQPMDPYSVSKAAQEMLGLQFHRANGLFVVVTRSFNHTGPGQRPTFVAGQFAKTVAEIRVAGGSGVVRAGNMDARRDFTDVRDVVQAYIALTEDGVAGQVYNVCSGRSYSVAELLEILADVGGVNVEVEQDPARMRRVDVPEMLGSYARLAEATGWSPQVDMRRSLGDLLEWYATRGDD